MSDFLSDDGIKLALDRFGLAAEQLAAYENISARVANVIADIYAYEEQQKANQDNALNRADRFTYIRAWPIERETGQFLYRLARYLRPEIVLECGTSFGISALHWASALQVNGHGRLITVEVSKLKHDAAQLNFEKAGLAEHIQMEKLAFDQYLKRLSAKVDLVFLDCDRKRYAFYFAILKHFLPVGGYIVADNAIDRAEDMNSFKASLNADSNFIYDVLPIGDGLLLAKKVA